MTGFELQTSGIGSDPLPTEPHNHCPSPNSYYLESR